MYLDKISQILSRYISNNIDRNINNDYNDIINIITSLYIGNILDETYFGYNLEFGRHEIHGGIYNEIEKKEHIFMDINGNSCIKYYFSYEIDDSNSSQLNTNIFEIELNGKYIISDIKWNKSNSNKLIYLTILASVNNNKNMCIQYICVLSYHIKSNIKTLKCHSLRISDELINFSNNISSLVNKNFDYQELFPSNPQIRTNIDGPIYKHNEIN